MHKNTKFLVIGATGLLGSYLYKSLQEKYGEDNVVGTYYSQEKDGLVFIDICEPNEIEYLFSQVKPNVVYLPAAQTNVNSCEVFPKSAFEINVRSVRDVVEYCNKYKAKLIFFSSAYVFSGYPETQTVYTLPEPLNEYGMQKLQAEHVITSTCHRYNIVRIMGLFGKEDAGKNYLYQVLNFLQGEMPAVNDQFMQFTYAKDLANECTKEWLIDGRKTNRIWHMAGEKSINKFEFANMINEIFKLGLKILPVETYLSIRGSGNPVRPKKLCFTDSCVTFRPLEEQLLDVKHEIESEQEIESG